MLGGRWKTSWRSVLHNFRFPWWQHKAVWSVYFLTAKTWNSSGHWWRRRQSLIESLKRERAITGTREQTKTAFLENNPFSCFIKRQSIFHVDLLSLCLVSNYRCIIVSSFTERSCVSVSVSVCLWSFFLACLCVHVYLCYLSQGSRSETADGIWPAQRDDLTVCNNWDTKS